MMCWECSCQMEHVRRLTHDKRSSVRVVGAATKTLIRISEGSDRRVAMFWAAMLWYSFLFRRMRGRSESSASGRCESRANAQASLARPSALPAARQMHLVQTQPPPPNLNPRCPRAVRLSEPILINMNLADHCAEPDTHDHHSKSHYSPKVRAQLPHRLELSIKDSRLTPNPITFTCSTPSAHLRLPPSATSPDPYIAGASNHIEPTPLA